MSARALNGTNRSVKQDLAETQSRLFIMKTAVFAPRFLCFSWRIKMMLSGVFSFESPENIIRDDLIA